MPNPSPTSKRKPLLLALLSAGILAASFNVQAASDGSTGMSEETRENAAATDARSNDAVAGTSSGDPALSGARNDNAASAGDSGGSGTGAAGSLSQDEQAATMGERSGASASGSDAKGGDALAKSDQDLMREITQANLAEIMTAQLALDKTQDPEVKEFAQQMLDDHTAAQADLTTLAQDKGGMKLPIESDAKHRAEYDKLKAMSGKDFDQAYMQRAGVQDHTKTHAKLESAEKRAKDPDLQAYIAETKETVAGHLKLAKDITADQGTATGSSGTAGTMGSGAAVDPDDTAVSGGDAGDKAAAGDEKR